ncbi:hypothetical protein ACNTMW_13395 [Planosporangium sp. 12N6]|uniref:hypothetical protein n=1 Tax=Planosporangium spinosum TaxID=3402278 RepID=UPI003CF69326
MHVTTMVKRIVVRVPWAHRAARSARRRLEAGRLAQRRAGRQLPDLRRLMPARAAGPTARVRYCAVLDGETLNIDFVVPVATDASEVRLRLTAGNRTMEVPARVRHVDAGSTRACATVRLGRSGLGIVRPGRWRLSCAVSTADGTRTYPLCGVPAAAWPDGPTIRAPRSPESGLLYRPEEGPGGRTELAVLAARPTAELVDVVLDWTRAELVLRTVGISADTAAVEFTSREGAPRARVDATVEGDRIICPVPVALLAPRGRAQEWVWDPHLVTGGMRLRIGRSLHDLVDAKKTVRTGAVVVWASPESAVRTRPYLTSTGRLALACNLVSVCPEVDA